jgi:hypothetical protein
MRDHVVERRHQCGDHAAPIIGFLRTLAKRLDCERRGDADEDDDDLEQEAADERALPVAARNIG